MGEALTKSAIESAPDFALNRQMELHQRAVTHKIDNASAIGNMQQIEEAAQEFEAVFAAEMLKPMFAQIKSDPMFGGGKGEEVFQDMMVQEYGKMIAERGGIGLKDQIMAEMIRIQEHAQNR